MKLYLYSNGSVATWAESARDYRRRNGFSSSVFCYRAAPGRAGEPDSVSPPAGMRLVGNGLADSFAERVPAMRDFVNALAP